METLTPLIMAASCLNSMITDLSGACKANMVYLSPIGCREENPKDPMYWAWMILCCISSVAMIFAMYATAGGIPASSLSVVCCSCLLSGPLLFNTEGRKILRKVSWRVKQGPASKFVAAAFSPSLAGCGMWVWGRGLWYNKRIGGWGSGFESQRVQILCSISSRAVLYL